MDRKTLGLVVVFTMGITLWGTGAEVTTLTDAIGSALTVHSNVRQAELAARLAALEFDATQASLTLPSLTFQVASRPGLHRTGSRAHCELRSAEACRSPSEHRPSSPQP